MCLFADDCLIYPAITSTQDHKILQDDLNAVITWANEWEMEFSLSKCKIFQPVPNITSLIACI